MREFLTEGRLIAPEQTANGRLQLDAKEKKKHCNQNRGHEDGESDPSASGPPEELVYWILSLFSHRPVEHVQKIVHAGPLHRRRASIMKGTHRIGPNRK